MTTYTKISSINNRYDFLDLLRGVLILFIVWEHCYEIGNGLVERMFCAVSMPGFVFISALCYKDAPIKQFALRVINRLVMPILLFEALFYAAYLLLTPDLTFERLKGDVYILLFYGYLKNYAMWYVRSLAIMMVVNYTLDRLRLNKVGEFIAMAMLFAVGVEAWYTIGFVQSYCPGNEYAVAYLECSMPFTLMMLPLFRCFVKAKDFFLRDYSMKVLLVIAVVSTVIWLITLPSEFIWFHRSRFRCNVFQYYVTVCSAFVACISVAKMIKTLPIVNYIGKSTMVVLGLHLIYIFVMCALTDITRWGCFYAILPLLPIMVWASVKWMPMLTGKFDYLVVENGKIMPWFMIKKENRPQ